MSPRIVVVVAALVVVAPTAPRRAAAQPAADPAATPAAAPPAVAAPPAAPTVAVTGYVEAYYQYSLARPSVTASPLRFEPQLGSFTLASAAVQAMVTDPRWHATAGLQVGATPAVLYGTEPAPATWQHVREASAGAEERDERHLPGIELVAHQQQRWQREGDAGREALAGRARGLDDVVLQ